jgi:DNA/RNA endonuclease YhcR with UshA esterase domain
LGAIVAGGINVMENKQKAFGTTGYAMIKWTVCILCVALTPLIAGGQVSAHHGSSNYDLSKSVSVKGTVTQFEFMNPHSAIHLEANDDKGTAEQWLIEADSPNNLARAGWTRGSLKPGDRVTIVGNRLKDGSKVMRLQKVIFSDGKELKPREGDDY